jgi:hypothetical protein
VKKIAEYVCLFLLMILFAVYVYAASNPPQVGETVYIPLKTADSALTWTASALKDGSAYVNITSQVAFTNHSAFQTGLYEAVWTPATAGEYQLLFTPSSGSAKNWYQNVGSSAFDIATSVDARLSTKHGTGDWRAGSFKGSIDTNPVTSNSPPWHVTRGDSVDKPYTLSGYDLTGYTVWFGAKSSTSSTSYDIALREITSDVTSAEDGMGVISLTTTDTAIPTGLYYAEIEIRKGSEVKTPLRFNLYIDAEVIR